MATKPFFRRRKSDPFEGENAPKIDYKDVKLLQRFLSCQPVSPLLVPRTSVPSPARSSARVSWLCCHTP